MFVITCTDLDQIEIQKVQKRSLGQYLFKKYTFVIYLPLKSTYQYLKTGTYYYIKYINYYLKGTY